MATIKEIAGKRSTCLGVVTRHVNTLRNLITRMVDDAGEECSSVVNKLLEAKGKLDALQKMAEEAPDVGQQLKTDIKESFAKATFSVVSILDDYEQWKVHGPVVVGATGGSEAVDKGMDVQAATLSVLVQLQKSMESMAGKVVESAVERALLEQTRAHEQEKTELLGTITELSHKLDRAQLLSDVAQGKRDVEFDFSDVPMDGVGGSERVDERLMSTMRHSRESAGPIRNRLTGFGRGRLRPSAIRNSGVGGPRVSYGGEQDSLLMQSLLEQSAIQHQSLMANLQAPRVTMKEFGGDPLEYAVFITTFDDLIHNVVDSDRSKLLQLTKHCVGRAGRAIAGCAHMAAEQGYREARKILHDKFGAPHVVTQAWIDKMLEYPALSTGEVLDSFASDLECCRNSLKSLNSIAEIESTGSLRIIVAKLPGYLRAKWRKVSRKTRDNGELRIDALVKLVKEAAEDVGDPAFSEEVIARVRSTYGVKSPTPQSGRSAVEDCKGHVNCARNEFFMGCDDQQDYVEGGVFALSRSACAACRSGQHFTSRCRNFKELSPTERLEFVKKKGLCMLCLADNHIAEKCPLPWRCQEKTCGRRHHTSLHGAFATAEVHTAECEEVLPPVVVDAQSYCMMSASSLPVVQVVVRFQDRSRVVNALLDSGSTVTMVHEKVVEDLETRAIHTGRDFLINTVTTAEQFPGKIINLQVSRVGERERYPLGNAMVLPKVPVSPDCLPSVDSINSWSHLKKLNITFGELKAIEMIIGQNNSHLLDPGRKVKNVKTAIFAPYAVEYPIGWAIYGCLEEEADWAGGDVPLSYAIGGVDMIPCLQSLDIHDGGVSERCGGSTENCQVEAVVETEEESASNAGCADVEYWCDHEEVWEDTDVISASNFNVMSGELCSDRDDDHMRKMEEQLKRLADLDDVPHCDLLPAEEKLVLELWERTMKIEHGHIVLPIPFKEEPPDLVNNFYAAYRALQQLGRRLMDNPEELAQYKEAIEKYFKKGYAEIIEDDDPAGMLGVWYLIHHGVRHPRKPNVIRVVKNGAAEYKGCSLNKAAYKGPDMMNQLVSVLTRFRQFRIGTSGDLEGMYNQVWVPVTQRDYGRFLFWEDGDPSKRVIICRMKTHVFGSIWAPAAANFAIKKLAEMEKDNPEVAESIRREFYVDDWLNSERDDERAMNLLFGVKAAVARGSFNMGKIASSSRTVLSRVEAGDRAKELAKIDVASDKLPRGVMLGQNWEPDPDSLVFRVLVEPKPFTKRGMTSCVSSIFDPLGLLCPFILPAKVLMQQACKGVKGWDEMLDSVTADQWTTWIKELEEVEKFRVKRWFGCEDGSKQIFHAFSDASERAYAAATFLAVMKGSASGESTLVSAKSRVAPTKKLTIPQLEMAGAVLAVKITSMMLKIFSVIIKAVFYWIDSTIVLVLIHKDPGELKTYMGNRVTFIQQMTDVTQWGHVPGSVNPADIASRGMKMSELNNSDLWARGPEFIRQPQEAWPARTVKIKNSDNIAAEMKKKKSVFVVEVCTLYCSRELSCDPEEVNTQFVVSGTSAAVISETEKIAEKSEKETAALITGRYSSWNKVVRLAAYVTMFVNYLRASVKENKAEMARILSRREPIAEELEVEERNLIAWAQKLEITCEDRWSNSWKKLTPVKKELWRVGGRFLYAEMKEDEMHPIILPRKGAVTELLIQKAHIDAGHGGADRTLMELRRSYWVLGGRVTVKRCTDACIKCRRLKASPVEQQMAPLPAERLVRGRPVFWYCGVDLFGPVTVVLKRSSVKRYGALFTCMNTRAVHLEPVEDLTTSAFVDTLERFVDRRGKPGIIQSDNGKNFVGAKKELSRAADVLKSVELSREMANRRIRWQFNSPSASHQGGVWERLIRSVRMLLVVLTDGKGLSDSRFHTVLCMAEAIMNSRPLTRLSEDVEGLDALTPFHFISLQAVTPLFPAKYEVSQLKKDWRYSQGLAGEFWDQWMGLYVPSLQKRTKWLSERRNVKKGELVLIVNDQYARCDWPLGIISRVHPGRDGLVRNVTVRTKNGFLTRPVQKIVRLEMDVT